MPETFPQRTCIGCQTKKSKKKLARITIGENNHLTVDRTGKSGGRGAYVCKIKNQKSKIKIDENCLEMAIEKKAFQRAFKKKVKVNKLWQDKKNRNQKNQSFNSAPQ